jgi:hypothetical protein
MASHVFVRRAAISGQSGVKHISDSYLFWVLQSGLLPMICLICNGESACLSNPFQWNGSNAHQVVTYLVLARSLSQGLWNNRYSDSADIIKTSALCLISVKQMPE